MSRWPLALVAAFVILGGCAPRMAPEAPAEGTYPYARYECPADARGQLGPPVVVVTPLRPADQPLADWNTVADAVPYPELARRARIQGTIPATVTVDARGHAARVDVSDDAAHPDLLVEAVREGLLAATYVPERRNASPTAGAIDVLVVFRSRLCGEPTLVGASNG